MKIRLLTLLALMVVLMSVCNAQYVITETISVDLATLTAIRNSLDSSSDNYDPILNSLTRSADVDYDVDTLPPAALPGGYTIIKDAANNLNTILFFGNQDVQQDYFDDTIASINSITSVDEIMNFFTGSGYPNIAEAATRGLCMANLTVNASYLYDCMYYKQYNADGVPDSSVISAVAILQQVMLECIGLLNGAEEFYNGIYEGYITGYKRFQHGVWAKDFRTTASGDMNGEPPYPGLNLHQYRLNMYGAAGLAALLIAETSYDDPMLHTSMAAMVDSIDNKLELLIIPQVFPEECRKAGMLAFHTSNSGAYNESISYAGFLLKYVTPYFVARKRLSAGMKNYFNNPFISSWINDMAKKVVPAGGSSMLGYNWNYNDSYHKSGFYPGVLLFFYHAGNPFLTEKTNAAWLVNCSRNSSGNYEYIESGDTILNSFFIMRYSSDPSCSPKISALSTLPNFIINGSWTNSEFSILRPPTSSKTEFLTAASLNVLHENSWGSAHAHADQSSYTYYHAGERFLLDSSGSWSDHHSWRVSPYAHNMVIIDPQSDVGYLVDPQYRPVSGIQDFNKATFTPNEIEPDPCRKDYFQRSAYLDVLSVGLDYRDSADYLLPIGEQGLDCQLERTIIRDNDIYVVYDAVDTTDDTIGHEFWNLLHFDSMSVSLSDDTFAVTKSATVDISCGSLDVTFVTEGFELLLTEYNAYYRGKQRVSNATDPSFLTIIAPRIASASRVVDKVTVIDESHCTAISGISITDPTINTITYIGCTNGEDQDIEVSDATIETNGRMFVATRYVTANPITLDRSMVLLGGDYLRANDTALFEMFNGVVKGVTSTYKGDELAVVFHGTAISFPRFKIYRSGADPSQFSSIMRTQLEPQIPEPIPYPEDPNYRYFSTNIVQSLAYDGQYFYVNYSWNDLDAAGLINDELVIVKGEIPIINLNTDLNIQGDVSITGSITINNGASMDVYPNSSILVSDGAGISNRGVLNISGGASRTVSIGSSSQQWSGIITYRDGSLICDGTVFTGAITGIQIRGNSTISNSEISDCHQGISIETGTPFSIDGSLIQNNTYGIVISNNYTTSDLGHIQNNEITQNGIGMLLYNSNTKIALNDIHNNTRAGLYLVRGSEPIVKGCNISFTEQNGLSRPEIRLESDSYPIIDDARNDINADGLGYSLFYDSTGRIKQLMARNNYWGSTNPFGIRQWMYPLDWDVVYDPYSTEPNTFFPHVFDNLFKQALAAEESGDTALAKQLYSTIVATEPDSLYALQSLGRLNSIYSGSPSLLSELRTLYDAYSVACDDSVLVKNAQIKSVMIDRFDGLFLQALQEYDLQLQLSTTELDSLLCLLDIAYTLEDMYYDDLGKGSYSGLTYLANGLNITSLKDARQTVQQLWGEILAKSDNSTSDNVPVPTKMAITNYPNPFNPSTTIAFSLPVEGIVRLSVYNIRGQRVRDLLSGSLPRGFHKVVWDGKDNGNRSVSSGLYFVRIESGKTSSVRKIMMLK